jgi:hypothetical protein
MMRHHDSTPRPDITPLMLARTQIEEARRGAANKNLANLVRSQHAPKRSPLRALVQWLRAAWASSPVHLAWPRARFGERSELAARSTIRPVGEPNHTSVYRSTPPEAA